MRAWLGRRGLELASRYTDRDYLPIDYPTSARNEPRWAPHAGLARVIGERDADYAAVLEMFSSYREDFRRIPVRAEDPRDPGWINGWQPALDGAALYSFTRSRSPQLYLEIGSGTSTKFVRRAIEDGGLSTRITSIDPHPRAEIDGICDTVIRSPFEAADLSVFDQLVAGDVVFLDGSHRVFMNSDATVFLLEVLPKLPAGVLVGIHDIYLPSDYPAGIADRYYSEQYLLAAYVLAGTARFETALPAWYVWETQKFRPLLESLWEGAEYAEIERHGGAYWVTMT